MSKAPSSFMAVGTLKKNKSPQKNSFFLNGKPFTPPPPPLWRLGFNSQVHSRWNNELEIIQVGQFILKSLRKICLRKDSFPAFEDLVS